MKTRLLVGLTIALCSLSPAFAAEPNVLSPEEKAAGWHLLFDGHSLDGWKASETPGSFSVVDGTLVVKGPRSHLFYVGDLAGHDFKNFELSAEVLTKPKANSGIYFHTEWQQTGWPAKGYEIQVNNTHKDPKRTAGIYGIKDNFTAPVADGTWFTLHIRVEGKRIVASVDGKVISDFTEPEEWTPPANFAGRRLGRGTFAVQGHDPESEVHYRNLKVRLLP